MPAAIKILGISGSLRAKSFNTALMKAAAALAASDVAFETVTLHGIPLYDGDLEQQDGIPSSVAKLKAQIKAADGVLLFTPEYNNGIPGVFKNAIDWLSRPSAEIAQAFGNRPFAVLGASLSGFGTILAQHAWLPVLKTLGTRHWSGGRLLVSRASQVFDGDGQLIDEGVRRQLGEFVAGFAAFAGPRAG